MTKVFAGILSTVALSALTAAVGLTVSEPPGPGSAPADTTATTAHAAASFSLVATWFEPPPPPPPPPAAAPEAVAPHTVAPEAVAPHTEAPHTVEAPVSEPPVVAPPPPPPPPQLVLRLNDPLTAAFVSITNNGNASVGCVMKVVPVAGLAAAVNYFVPDNNFTVAGGQEARIPAGSSLGPATGSTFHFTVNCDNGLSTGTDTVY